MHHLKHLKFDVKVLAASRKISACKIIFMLIRLFSLNSFHIFLKIKKHKQSYSAFLTRVSGWELCNSKH